MIRTLLALTVCVAAAAAALGETIDESRDADPRGRVSINNINGSVRVEAWDEPKVHLTGTLGPNIERVEFDREGDRVRIHVVYPRNSGRGGYANLDVKVPRASELAVDTVNSEIEVVGVEGEQDLKTVNGSILSKGGQAAMSASTVNGEIELDGKYSRVRAKTISGSIDVTGAAGDVSAEAVSADIRVKGDSIRLAECQTISGDIEFEGGVVEDARLEFHTNSGDIELRLPADTSAEFDVSTFSGDIDNRLSEDEPQRKRFGPGTWIEFRLGDGSARIEANAFSGDVKLDKI